MRSLFLKILLWFLGTVVVAVVGSVVIFQLSAPGDGPPTRWRRGLHFRLGEARFAYEEGGPVRLRGFMTRMHRREDRVAIFLDEVGTDLVTGEDHSAIIHAAKAGEDFIQVGESMYFAVGAADGRYWLVQRVPPGMVIRPFRFLPPWFFPPNLIWIAVAFSVFCFLLARHLTSPVRKLERAVHSFGSGDLSARVGSKRKDELGNLARTFDRMADRIQSLVSGQRRLLLDISHELRSPLTRLGMAVELARSEGRNGAALDRIQTEADRLNELIGEIIAFNRSDAETSAMKRSVVRLDQLLGEIADVCSVEAEAKSCQLSLAADDAITVNGDEELLRRAIENVIRNAIRYTEDNTSVEVEARPSAVDVLVSIRDHGPGVPLESLGQLFDPFYRVEGDRSRASGGVGLGLAIARRSVELHEGTIRARNADPGLIVEIRLPLAPVRVPDVRQSAISS